MVREGSDERRKCDAMGNRRELGDVRMKILTVIECTGCIITSHIACYGENKINNVYTRKKDGDLLDERVKDRGREGDDDLEQN